MKEKEIEELNIRIDSLEEQINQIKAVSYTHLRDHDTPVHLV